MNRKTMTGKGCLIFYMTILAFTKANLFTQASSKVMSEQVSGHLDSLSSFKKYKNVVSKGIIITVYCGCMVGKLDI